MIRSVLGFAAVLLAGIYLGMAFLAFWAVRSATGGAWGTAHDPRPRGGQPRVPRGVVSPISWTAPVERARVVRVIPELLDRDRRAPRTLRNLETGSADADAGTPDNS